jgi:hypothetical protein
MGLAIPAFALPVVAQNFPTTIAADMGQLMTNLLGASNTKGSWVEIISDALVTENCCWIDVNLALNFASATDTASLVDIGIDRAGGTTWEVLIPNLLAGWCGGLGTVAQVFQYSFPLFIPRGSSVAVRGQNATASARSINVAVTLRGGSNRPDGPWCGQKVTAYGVNTGTSKGSSITAGSSSAYGSFASVGSTLAEDSYCFDYGVQGLVSGTTMSALRYYFEVGVGSAQISPTRQVQTTTSEITTGLLPVGPFYRSLAAGTQMQMRGKCSGTAQAMDCAIYAVS